MKINLKYLLKKILSLFIVVSITYFFVKQFQNHWADIQAYHINFRIPFLFSSLFFIVFAYLLNAYGWHITINSLSLKKLKCYESIAFFNISNLAKYLPGKVWGYATQIYYLNKVGFSKSAALYADIVNIFVNLNSIFILGFLYLTFLSHLFPFAFSSFWLITIIIINIIFIYFNPIFSKLFIHLINKIFKKTIPYILIKKRTLIYLYIVSCISQLTFGMGGYLLSIGIGLDVQIINIFSITAAMTLSDAIGFLTLISPAGLGVREGIMLLLLKELGNIPLALVLPIASRIMCMLTDVILGILGLLLLKKILKKNKETLYSPTS